jgi:homoaconitase/3-isopropylmalate dehydratase large subunit
MLSQLKCIVKNTEYSYEARYAQIGYQILNDQGWVIKNMMFLCNDSAEIPTPKKGAIGSFFRR